MRLIDADALKEALTNPSDKHYLSKSILDLVFKRIDNLPTASDRYYEGYAQGYIHGSTGADWQGE